MPTSRRWFWLILLLAAGPAAADWPTLHKDYQRSGYSGEVLRGPMQRKWFRSFVEEMVGPRAEAIVAEELCFVGTYAGNLHALNIGDGRTVWKYQADGPIGHSPCYRDGKLYFCTDAGFDAGSLICLSARDGKPLWTYHAAAGFWNSPACDGRQVYVGDRSGVFHAVDAATGRVAWTLPTGGMILKPASFSADGRKIVFGSEDMRVYCVSPEGKLLWKSSKLPGLSLRDAAPTVWGDKVVVRTNPANSFHEALHEGGRLVNGIQRNLPWDAREDKVVVDTDNMYFVARTPRREKAEFDGVRKYLEEHPQSRTWFTLGLDDGREPWIAPVMFTSGLHNPPSPPAFNPATMQLYTIMPTAVSVYCSGVSQVGIGIGRLGPDGTMTNIAHDQAGREPGYFAGMPMITDETSSVSLMGDFLVVTHMGAVGGVDLQTRQIRQLHGRRDTYGGLFGPGAAKGSWDGSKQLAAEGYVQNTVNEWHGPDRSIVAIDRGRMFWVVGGCVVCFGGPDVPAGPSAGNDPPEPMKWQKMPRIDGGNLTGSFGAYDANLKKQVFSVEEIRQYLQPPKESAPADNALVRQLRDRLDAAVTELIDGGPWAPLLVELGISHEELHFWRSSETMQTLAMTLPHLSPSVREKAVRHLDTLFDAGVPLERPVVDPRGRRREYYDLSPELLAGPAAHLPQYSAGIADLYAVWAYAHHADRWSKVLAQATGIEQRFRDSLAAPFRFRADDVNGTAVEDLNGRIAGAIAYARIMRKAGRPSAAEPAEKLLAEMMAERVHFEKADPRLQSKREHHATIPRYLGLTPEVGQMLVDHARQPLETNLADLRRELPVWYQAWGERLIGGENYTSGPTLARAVFLAMADAAHTGPQQLARYLDQPWCRADLYQIEKLSAALRASSETGSNPGR